MQKGVNFKSQENVLEPQGAHLQARCLGRGFPAQAVGRPQGWWEALGKGPRTRGVWAAVGP